MRKHRARQKDPTPTPALPSAAEVDQALSVLARLASWYRLHGRDVPDAFEDGQRVNFFSGVPDGMTKGGGFALDGKECQTLTHRDQVFLRWLWNDGNPYPSATREDVGEFAGVRFKNWSAFKTFISRLDGRLKEDSIYLGFHTEKTAGLVTVERFREEG